MHGVGTVVFTVSALFGVPVVPHIWSLTRAITSYAREIVASLAKLNLVWALIRSVGYVEIHALESVTGHLRPDAILLHRDLVHLDVGDLELAGLVVHPEVDDMGVDRWFPTGPQTYSGRRRSERDW